MSKELVRMVSGPNAGDEMWWDRAKSGPVIRVAEHPDFVVCRGCRTEEMPPTETFHQTDYLIHELKYDSGHRHLLAAPLPMRVVDLMNVLWDSYEKSEGK